MTKKKSQAQRLLEFLQGGNSITSLESFYLLGITQLSARVIDLERENNNIIHTPIKVTNRFGESVRVIQYSMGEK